MKRVSIRGERIAFFEQRLLDFFGKAGRSHLPWRQKKITAYEVWVSEIMLQQTQVNRVIEYYTRFLKRFPAIEDLAAASWDDFLPYYQGLGYYARGRNMLKAAQIIVREHGGRFPRERETLQKIPGIGPYTASAILSFAYGEDHLAWDTNLKRAIGRFFRGGRHLVGDEAFWETKFRSSKKELNAALMDFGSAICTGRPKCGACMLRPRCTYFRTGGALEKKAPTTRSTFPEGAAQAFIWLHEDHRRYFSAKRNGFAAFRLPPAYNTRAGIKQYFSERYGLELSVRPPHRRGYFDGRPTLFVNAQILLGTPSFPVFPKQACAEYTERMLDSLKAR